VSMPIRSVGISVITQGLDNPGCATVCARPPDYLPKATMMSIASLLRSNGPR
jgi:hypothetical protein